MISCFTDLPGLFFFWNFINDFLFSVSESYSSSSVLIPLFHLSRSLYCLLFIGFQMERETSMHDRN